MATSVNLRSIYKQLLRSASRYPSRNREKIYKSIQEDFRINAGLDSQSEEAKKCIEIAMQGMSQLRQFDEGNMVGSSEANWDVHMTTNPMPKQEGGTSE